MKIEIDSKYVTGNITQISNDLPERNQVYFLPDMNLILKCHGNENNWKREILSLSSVKRKNCFEMPNILESGIDNNIHWAVMSFLHGSPVDQLIASGETIDSCLYKEIGQLHAMFHVNNTMKFRGDWSKHEQSLTANSYLKHERDKNRKYANLVLDNTGSDQTILKKAYKKMLEYEKYFTVPDEFCLCHNDFSERNILYDPNKGKVTGVIDFERAYPSDPETDLLKMVFKNFDTRNLEDYLASYSSVRPLSDNFQSKLLYLLFAFCFEIASWAKKLDINYYNQAIKLLNKIL